MIGRDELIAIMATPPVDLDTLGFPDDPDEASADNHADYQQAMKCFWLNEGVNWEEIVEWSASCGLESAKVNMSGIATTPEEFDDIVAGFAAAHLAGFMVGWMVARGMGSTTLEGE